MYVAYRVLIKLVVESVDQIAMFKLVTSRSVLYGVLWTMEAQGEQVKVKQPWIIDDLLLNWDNLF